MPYFKIEPNIYYVRIEQGYIIDCITYKPQSSLYQKYEGEIPPHILSRCYKLKNGKIVVDQAKYQQYLAELEQEVSEIE